MLSVYQGVNQWQTILFVFNYIAIFKDAGIIAIVACVAFPLKAENFECVVFESILLNETLPFISGLD